MSHGSPVDLVLQVRGQSVGSGPRRVKGGPRPHIPCTRLIHSCIELEGLLEVVETDHRLVERAHLNAAPVAGEAEGLRGLRAQHLVRAPPHPRQAPGEGLRLRRPTEARSPAGLAGTRVQRGGRGAGPARLTVKLLG